MAFWKNDDSGSNASPPEKTNGWAISGSSINISDGTLESSPGITSKTSTEWFEEDPILPLGEIGIDVTNKIIKIGDGTNKWSEIDSGIPMMKIDNKKLKAKGSLIDKFNKGGVK